MDNLTHTLVGLCLGKSYRAKTAQQRKEAVVAGIVSSNLPDLDILYHSISEVENLSYLLHHRGHTHTLALLPLLAGLSWLFSSLLTGGKAKWKSKIFLISVFGVLIHIFMDFLNSYGVHPFWPVDSSWYYGDSLFIIEPTIWFSLLAFAFWSAQRNGAKVFWALISVAALSILWIEESVSLTQKVILTLFFLGMQLWQSRTGGNIKLAWSSLLSLIMIFALCSGYSEWRVRKHIVADFPQENLVQLARRPYPGNPFCWSNIMVTESEPQLYIVRTGYQTLLPLWLECRDESKSYKLDDIKRFEPNLEASNYPGEIAWEYELVKSSAELRQLYSENCQVRSALRFYRAPYWRRLDGQLLFSDLRFMRANSFAQVEITSDECPPYVPGWTPPLEELFEEPELNDLPIE